MAATVQARTVVETAPRTIAKVQILPLRKTSNAKASNASVSLASETLSADGTGSVQVRSKRKRQSSSKVRSGCITCKIRKVKCDEEKPECRRCTSTGRKCDGYVMLPRKQIVYDSLVRTTTPVVKIYRQELRAIEFFCQKTIPGLSTYFDAEFWTRLVVQMSSVEPSVRHAIAAVGSLHAQRQFEASNSPFVGAKFPRGAGEEQFSTARVRPEADSFTLMQYNKALVQLHSRLNAESSVDVALLTCILFVCLEYMRGEAGAAMDHFRSGMHIAMAAISGSRPQTPASTFSRIKNQFLPFMNRIELISALSGNDTSWEYPVDVEDAVQETFDSITEARDSLVHVVNISHRFIQYIKTRKQNYIILQEDLSRQTIISLQLKLWEKTLDRMLLTAKLTFAEVYAAKTLLIHKIVSHIWLRVCTHTGESYFDDFNSDFDRAVTLAEVVQRTFNSPEQRRNLNSSASLFDMEIVGPMYYCAISCRHPKIRRRAIDVLSKTHRQEGLWDSNMAAAVAVRCVEVEEAKLAKIDGTELPEESERLQLVHVPPTVGGSVGHQEVTLYSLPDTIGGRWAGRKELIHMDEAAARGSSALWQLPSIRDPTDAIQACMSA